MPDPLGRRTWLWDTGVVIGGVLLSGLLTVLFAWLDGHTTEMRLARELSARSNSGQRLNTEQLALLSQSVETLDRRQSWLYCPIVAALVGGFGGFVSRQRAWQLSSLGVAPFAAIFSLRTISGTSTWAFFCLYLAISAVVAMGVARQRGRAWASAQR